MRARLDSRYQAVWSIDFIVQVSAMLFGPIHDMASPPQGEKSLKFELVKVFSRDDLGGKILVLVTFVAGAVVVPGVAVLK